MDDQVKAQVKKLQEKIDMLEGAEEDLKRYHLEQGEVEAQIVLKEKEVQDSRIALHRNKKEEQREVFEEALAKGEKELFDLKKRKREIDEKIDEIEELGEMNRELLAEELEAKIFSLSPCESIGYTKLLSRKKKKEAYLETLKELFKGHQKLYDHLATAVATRKEAFGRGLINYVFGPNPNFVISKNLQQGGREAEELLERMESVELPEIFFEISPTLKILVDESKKPWSFSSFNRIYYSLFDKISDHLRALEKTIERAEREILIVKEEMRNWTKM